MHKIAKEIIEYQNTILSNIVGGRYEFPEYMEATENPMKKLKKLPPPPEFSTEKKYAFLKIQSLGVDNIKYKNVDEKEENRNEDNEFLIVDIHNLQSTAKGYGPKLVKSMLDTYSEEDKLLYIVLSPYLQNNIGLHRVYHDKWNMKYEHE